MHIAHETRIKSIDISGIGGGGGPMVLLGSQSVIKYNLKLKLSSRLSLKFVCQRYGVDVGVAKFMCS